MGDTIFEEDLSISYLRAVAAQAQVVFDLKHRDVNSKDAELSKTIETKDGPFPADLHVQLKSTYSSYVDLGAEISYPLKIKNYNDLRRKTTTPIILCLLILPQDKTAWVTQTPDELILRHCMYWISLKGYPDTQNEDTISIKIPKTNILNKESLCNILNQIANNGGVL